MPSNNNQLSTLLLLIVLGLLIYCLSKPSSSTTEKIEHADNVQLPTATTATFAQPLASQPQQVTVPEKVIQSVSAQQPATNTAVTTGILPTVDSSKMGVFSFEANDTNSIGAGLDQAFAKPISDNTRTDTVDINKYNVTKYDANDFLPKEINSKWFDTNFSQAKVNINDDKLINTERYIIGINTVGQSLKAASYDIRSRPPNPKFSISPWNNSTYEPDYNLKPLC
jgi:hypothetical protein